MIYSVEEIMEKARNGTLREYRVENLELKKGWSQEVGKKISALANSTLNNPTWLCVGIDDDGNVCGYDESWARETEEAVSQHINQYLDPQLTCLSITCHSVDNSWFVAIKHENPGAVVYWNKKAYKAAGTTIQEMTPAEVMQLTVRLPGLTDYTAQPCASEPDESAVTKFAQIVSDTRRDIPIVEVGGLPAQEVLLRLGIKDTNTSHILFGPCKYRVVYYDRQGIPIINETRTGLFGLLDDVFRREIQEWTQNQIGTITLPYPEKALKEALANAVAHAAYVEKAGDVIIEIFPDRICISNFCMGESEFFANKWFSRAHRTVNRTLMEVLRLAGCVDELGRGKNLIFAESLRYGKHAPEVIIERGGRYGRWKLFLYGGSQNPVQIRLLSRLRQLYPDEQKALIANALVLWRGHSVSDIRQYVDGQSSELFAEVLTDLKGPIFYFKERDQIVPQRWVSVLLGEGKDSKRLSPSEEADLLDFARKLKIEYNRGYITPEELRDLAGIGHTPSEKVLSSNLLILLR